MRKLILACIWVPLTLSSAFAWEVPSEVRGLVIGPYVAQNDASFKKVNVQAGAEGLV